MKRIDTATRAVDLYGAGKDGFKDGDLAGGVAPTDLNAQWFNQVQEEVARVVEGAGLTLNGADLTQLMQAIRLLTGGRLVRTTRYVRVAGVQNVSVNGAANTTTNSTTFTRQANTKWARVKVQGAGSGGAGGAAPAGGLVSLGAPGCSGSYGESIFDAATLGAGALTVTVGLGSAGNSGVVGGSSSFGVLLISPGGTGAGGLGSQTPPSLNGNGSAAAAPTGANLISISGSSPNLTIAQSATVGSGGSGGASVFGPGGNGPAMNTNGTNGINPGSGGSGALVNSGGGTATAGAGAPGIIIVEEYE